jgi:5-methylcytosine-specific restriction endonuclease McrA
MKRLTTKQFIKRSKVIHGDKYDYSLVEYKNARTKVKIICNKHGVFEQTPHSHLRGNGCKKCHYNKSSKNAKSNIKSFIENSIKIHNDKYDYSLVKYKNSKTKVKIICPIHGVFEQIPNAHLNGQGCKKCKCYGEIPTYNTFQPQLEPYGVKCKRNKKDKNILEVKCMYCDRWFIPSKISVGNKIRAINGKIQGECNLYCSDECKKTCPTYHRQKYSKDFKINTSREVQPELRKLVLKRDNYTCQKCGTTNTELHCHHYEGVEVNPVESADIDQCITLCKQCHNEVHRKNKCGIKDYKRGKCNEMERMAA